MLKCGSETGAAAMDFMSAVWTAGREERNHRIVAASRQSAAIPHESQEHPPDLVDGSVSGLSTAKADKPAWPAMAPEIGG